MTDALRIANCSGFYGDRLSAAAVACDLAVSQGVPAEKVLRAEGESWLEGVGIGEIPCCYDEVPIHEIIRIEDSAAVCMIWHLARREGVPIIGINWCDEADEAKRMLARLGNPFRKVGFDPNSDAVIEWGVYGAPETFLIDAEGIVRVKHTGAMNSQVWREKFQSYFVTGGGAS